MNTLPPPDDFHPARPDRTGARGAYPDDFHQQIVECWNNDMPTMEIARRFHLTRSAVLGLVSRLRIKDPLGVKSRPKALPPRNETYRKNFRNLNADGKLFLPTSGVTTPPPVKPPVKPMNKPARLDPNDPFVGKGVSVWDLGPHHCRWPLTDPKTHATTYCGHPALGGPGYFRSFCAYHADRAAHSQKRITTEGRALLEARRKTP